MTPLSRLDRAAAQAIGRMLPRRGSSWLSGAGLGVLLVGLALLVGSVHEGVLLWLPLSLLTAGVALVALGVLHPRD